MILRDNTEYVSTAENLETFLSLQNIANREISDLSGDDGNDILIYPHSFCQCGDEIDKQYLFSLKTHWKGKQCAKAILRTGNVAGFIGVAGQSVSIHSRFSINAEEDFFLHYMLSKVLCINVVNLSHGTADEKVFNFLLYLFPKFLNEALAQGMYKEYRRNEYNDANVRGVVDINRHLKTNMPFRGHVAYRTREFSYDNRITQLIRHTIEYIRHVKLGLTLLESDADTRANVAQIISATPRYDRLARGKVIKENSKIISHPYYSCYAPLQKLCLRILKHERVKYGAKAEMINGILFDVSYLWEEYLATLLVKRGFKHPKNKKGIGRIYLAKHRLPRYPDFYREDGHIIIDAKYKQDIDRDDIHQMLAYMYRLKGKNGIFVLPDKVCNRETYSLLGYGEDDNAELQTYSYPIPQAKTDYRQFNAEMRTAEEAFKVEFLSQLM